MFLMIENLQLIQQKFLLIEYKGQIMQTLDKPKTYQNQATVETVNAGIPYYVASPEFGYEGVHVPIAGSVSEMSTINPHTGELQLKDWNSPDKL